MEYETRDLSTFSSGSYGIYRTAYEAALVATSEDYPKDVHDLSGTDEFIDGHLYHVVEIDAGDDNSIYHYIHRGE
jgi:hypothetical protein